MPRNFEITVKCSQEEFDKIKRKSDDAGIPMSTFLRIIALKVNIDIVN